MEKNIKILFFANFPPPYTGRLIMTKMNYEFLSDNFQIQSINTSSGIFHLGQGYRYKLKRLLQIGKDFITLYKQIKKFKPDHLYFVPAYSADGHIRDWITILIAEFFNVRVTAHVHSGSFGDIFKHKWHKKITDYITSCVDTYIFVSQSLAERVTGHLNGSQIKIIQNSTEPSIRCSIQEVEKKFDLKLKTDGLNVVFLSNMIPSKGYLDLAKAVPLFKQNCTKEIKVNFIGQWPTKADLYDFENMINQLNIEDNVIVWGAIADRSKLKQHLLDADVFVLPTYYPVEAQPTSIIEAMNAATPIISTRHASIPDYIFDDENGYLVEKKAPQDISDALIKLTDKDNWKNKALAARRVYEEIFSPDIVKQKLITHFSSP